MSYKKRAITWTKAGEDRLEYWVVSDSGTISKTAPMRWHKVALEDQTTPATMETAACLRYRGANLQFSAQVDDNAWLRSNPPPDGHRYQALCVKRMLTV